MRSPNLTLTPLILIVCTAPALAAPLTSPPPAELRTRFGAPAPGRWTVAGGFAKFSFDYEQTVGNTTFGDKWSDSGWIASAEYSKPLSAGRTLALGGWLSLLGAIPNADNGSFAEIHGRYGFTPNWGLEVGGLFHDADALGKTMLHAVYQTEYAGVSSVKLQAGLGVLTGTAVGSGAAALGEYKTGLSAFANVSYPFSESLNGYLSVWVLSREFEYDVSAVGPGVPDLTSTTVQWSLGLSRDF